MADGAWGPRTGYGAAGLSAPWGGAGGASPDAAPLGGVLPGAEAALWEKHNRLEIVQAEHLMAQYFDDSNKDKDIAKVAMEARENYNDGVENLAIALAWCKIHGDQLNDVREDMEFEMAEQFEEKNPDNTARTIVQMRLSGLV